MSRSQNKQQPKVSAVIPTYRGKELMEKNLPSVFKALRHQDEVVVVDDGGFPKTLQWLQEKYHLGLGEKKEGFTSYEGRYQQGRKRVELQYVVNHETLRFAGNSNRGVELATHPLIFLVNDDCSCYPDTIKKLVPHFVENDDVFAVGCLEFDHEHGAQKSGKNKLWFEKGIFMHAPADSFEFGRTAWASGGSAMFDRQKWLQLGGFDLAYYPAYWEDIDLSQMGREAGWRILFEPQSKVDHNHETTNTTIFGQRKVEKMSWRHGQIFTWKHADFWQKVAYVLWRPYWWWQRGKRMAGFSLQRLGLK